VIAMSPSISILGDTPYVRSQVFATSGKISQKSAAHHCIVYSRRGSKLTFENFYFGRHDEQVFATPGGCIQNSPLLINFLKISSVAISYSTGNSKLIFENVYFGRNLEWSFTGIRHFWWHSSKPAAHSFIV